MKDLSPERLHSMAKRLEEVTKYWDHSADIIAKLRWKKIDFSKPEHVELFFDASSVFFHGAIFLQSEITKLLNHIVSQNPPLIGVSSTIEILTSGLEHIINSLNDIEPQIEAYFANLQNLVKGLSDNNSPTLDS